MEVRRGPRGLIIFALAVAIVGLPARGGARSRVEVPRRVAILAAADSDGARESVARALARAAALAVLDRGMAAAAAKGGGFDGSTNLTRQEARRLGLLTGADAVALVAVTYRELPPAPDRRAEAYLGLFLADARTGALVRFAGFPGEGPTRADALAAALDASAGELASWGDRLATAAAALESSHPPRGAELDLVFRDPPPGARPPRFFRKPQPAITAEAERARVTATVDLLVHFEANGSYGALEVDRWAGYGLDESAMEAVLRAPFVPAAVEGREASCRALLRYTFRAGT